MWLNLRLIFSFPDVIDEHIFVEFSYHSKFYIGILTFFSRRLGQICRYKRYKQ